MTTTYIRGGAVISLLETQHLDVLIDGEHVDHSSREGPEIDVAVNGSIARRSSWTGANTSDGPATAVS